MLKAHMPPINEIAKFRETIWHYYNQNKRDFPWRNTKDPYHILLSEVMLQQTQTNRVVSKYLEFLEEFPTVKDFAEAPFSKVLTHWSGLGYNRRAKFLWEAIKAIHENYNDEVPNSPDKLQELPGIGPYTSKAICTFAFNLPYAFLETNIRTVIIHFFFHDSQDKIPDKEILARVEETLDSTNPREWFYALMDYGNYLKSQKISHFEKQKHYTKQSKFKGSLRFVRGYILKELVKYGSVNISEIIIPGYTDEQIQKVIDDLHKESLIIVTGATIMLP